MKAKKKRNITNVLTNLNTVDYELVINWKNANTKVAFEQGRQEVLDWVQEHKGYFCGNCLKELRKRRWKDEIRK